MLEISNLKVAYGAIKALHGVTLKVPEKSIVTLIGANGAGKSTTLRAISGLVKTAGGTVMYDGEDITNFAPHQIVARGLCHVPEGRMIFANLTIAENLRMGAFLRKDAAGIASDMDYCFHVFPRLKERISQLAGTMSGGEQQKVLETIAQIFNWAVAEQDMASNPATMLSSEAVRKSSKRKKKAPPPRRFVPQSAGKHGFERQTAPVVREVLVPESLTVAELAQR
ncbi:MAG TPA: ATP-binding cassette domain-containing protein, partial [Verrucomicrobiales bacterium]|nr:ATP-binding cassette domain-containing protein [Verrucomicrobiales bacterium]